MFQYNNYFASVLDELGVPIESGCYVLVFGAGTRTLSTIYADSIGTAKTNPISISQFATDKKVKFFSTATSHDIEVFHPATGRRVKLAGATPHDDHRLVMEGQVAGLRHIIAPFTNSEAAEVDTTIDLPANFFITKVVIEVVTNVAGSSIEVGLLSSESGGDADGLVDAASCAAAAVVQPGATVTTGSNTKYFSANTLGVLLSDYQAGTDVDQDEGVFREKAHRCDGTAKSLTYTTSNHAVVGYIHLFGFQL